MTTISKSDAEKITDFKYAYNKYLMTNTIISRVSAMFLLASVGKVFG
jgi:hypothetical protein